MLVVASLLHLLNVPYSNQLIRSKWWTVNLGLALPVVWIGELVSRGGRDQRQWPATAVSVLIGIVLVPFEYPGPEFMNGTAMAALAGVALIRFVVSRDMLVLGVTIATVGYMSVLPYAVRTKETAFWLHAANLRVGMSWSQVRSGMIGHHALVGSGEWEPMASVAERPASEQTHVWIASGPGDASGCWLEFRGAVLTAVHPDPDW